MNLVRSTALTLVLISRKLLLLNVFNSIKTTMTAYIVLVTMLLQTVSRKITSVVGATIYSAFIRDRWVGVKKTGDAQKLRSVAIVV